MGETLRSAEARTSYDATLPPPSETPAVGAEKGSTGDNEAEAETLETTSDPNAAAAEPSAHAALLHTHGLAALQRGAILDAVDCLTQATQADSMKPLYHYDLGRALSKNPKWGHRAVQAFLKVIEIEPWNTQALVGLAWAYTRAGLKRKATDAWKAVRESDADNTDVARGLAELDKKAEKSSGMLKRLMSFELGSGSSKK